MTSSRVCPQWGQVITDVRLVPIVPAGPELCINPPGALSWWGIIVEWRCSSIEELAASVKVIAFTS